MSEEHGLSLLSPRGLQSTSSSALLATDCPEECLACSTAAWKWDTGSLGLPFLQPGGRQPACSKVLCSLVAKMGYCFEKWCVSSCPEYS